MIVTKDLSSGAPQVDALRQDGAPHRVGSKRSQTEGLRPATQEERSRRSTAQLLDAASELIMESGYAGVTLGAIGIRAGFSRGLATSRFGTKERLLEALVDRITVQWSHRRVLPRTTGKCGLLAVIVLLEEIGKQAVGRSKGLLTFYALCFEALSPAAELQQRFVEMHRTMRADVANLVTRGIEDGSIRADRDADDEAGAIVAALRGIAYQWFLDPEQFDPDCAFRHLLATTDERLRSEPMP